MGALPPQIQKKTTSRIVYSNALVLLDPNNSKKTFEELSQTFEVNKVHSIEQYFQYIRQERLFCDSLLICSGAIFNVLSKQLQKHKEDAKKITAIFIFCNDIERNKRFKKHPKVVCVAKAIEELAEMIKNYIHLPTFRNFNDSDTKTIQLHYSYFQNYLTYPVQESKRDQLIVKCINSLNRSKKSSQKKFSVEDYPKQLDFFKMLVLYSGNDLYSYINKILKLNSLKKIEEAHIIIHDIYASIRQHSILGLRRQVQSSVLYRGSIISLSQIKNLKNNIGSQMQAIGFFSTSQVREVAEKNFKGNVLFKIYIPVFFKDQRYKDLVMRGGYIYLNEVITPNFAKEYEVLFNIKSIFTVLKVQSKIKQSEQKFVIDLLFGKDQIIVYLNENKNKFVTQIHNKEFKNTQEICEKCQSNLHLIGVSSKERYCLQDFEPKNKLFKESFILENSKKTVTGIIIEYDEFSEAQFNADEGQKHSTLCQQCQSKVRCSGCNNQFSQFGNSSDFCLCELEYHSKEHLQNCYILVERDLPRFIMLELNEPQLDLFQNHFQLEKQIRCSADAFRLMKTQNSYIIARQEYTAIIESQDFRNLDYLAQYRSFFYRAETYRLRKYIVSAKQGLQIQEFYTCKKDYQRCLELVQDKPSQVYLQAKAHMSIGIIEDDIAQYIQKDQTCMKLPPVKSQEMLDSAVQHYEKAIELLNSIKKGRSWTKEETILHMNINNCLAFIEWHRKNFQKAISGFQNLLASMSTLKRPSKINQAKFLNNAAFCMKQYAKQNNWKDLKSIHQNLKKAVKYSERSYNLRSILFGQLQTLTINTKINFTTSSQLLAQCQQRMRKRKYY